MYLLIGRTSERLHDKSKLMKTNQRWICSTHKYLNVRGAAFLYTAIPIFFNVNLFMKCFYWRYRIATGKKAERSQNGKLRELKNVGTEIPKFIYI